MNLFANVGRRLSEQLTTPDNVKAKMWAISSDTPPVRLYPKAPLYNIIIIVDTRYLGRNEISNTKSNQVNNIAILPFWHL